MAKASETLVATDTFAAEVDGQTVIVHAGQTRVHAGHPLAKAHAHLFKQDEPHVDHEHKPRSRVRRKAA
jgi:hypothetical protein